MYSRSSKRSRGLPNDDNLVQAYRDGIIVSTAICGDLSPDDQRARGFMTSREAVAQEGEGQPDDGDESRQIWGLRRPGLVLVDRKIWVPASEHTSKLTIKRLDPHLPEELRGTFRAPPYGMGCHTPGNAAAWPEMRLPAVPPYAAEPPSKGLWSLSGSTQPAQCVDTPSPRKTTFVTVSSVTTVVPNDQVDYKLHGGIL